MSTFLFHETIFGPIHSRRLGSSLGINLLSTNCKQCTFDCIYCECGWTNIDNSTKKTFLSCIEISKQLEIRLKKSLENDVIIDNITFAGNGEPTIHPQFPEIIDETIRLRNIYYPKSKISVLSNATMLFNPSVIEALKKIDNNIQKLDSGSEEMFQLINQPVIKISLSEIVTQLLNFKYNLTLQTLFLRGEYQGKIIDNTTEKEIELWLKHINKINPLLVMLYPIARTTPATNLEKITIHELNKIAEKVENMGIKTQVYP
jgi:wyosine [tRNA(Phe)-imidazoG37] synthetase (radical SAM superfamily)